MLQELPDELLGEIVSLLDYRSVARLAQTSRSFAALASDALLWQHVYASTFDAPYRRDCASRTVEGVLGGLREPRGRTHKDKLKARLDALHAFLNYDTDLHCPTLLSLFYEMGEANAMVVSRCVAVKERKFEDREAECQAVRFELLCGGMPWQLARDFATKRNINLGNGHPQDIVKYFLSYPPGHGFEGRGRRQDLDPRSDYFLARMLFARQQGYRASPSFVHDMSSWTSSFLKASSMIVYDSIAYPLFHFPPHNIREPIRDHPMPRTLEDRARYHLRSGNRRPAPITATATCREPCVNWGVVETILQMVGLYKHGLPDLIPGLSIPRDCLEHEVPMEACMFDAGLAGHYRGVYAYLDFRELEHLDFGRPLAPDYFDGIQELVIEEEEAVEMFRPTATDPRADDQTAREGNTTDEDEDGEGEGWGESDHLDRLQDIPFRRFTANSHSRYHAHRHHIHGSSLQIPGYPAGFKVVRFESMFDEEHGLLPWIVEAVNIPSIGIVGRWRDRTEARGVAIEGPYVLWRDRVGDRIERERLVKLMTGSDVVAQDVMNEVTERYGMDAETLLAAWQKPDALARQVSPSSKAFERYIVVEATEVTGIRQVTKSIASSSQTARSIKTKPLPTLAALFGLSLFSTATPAQNTMSQPKVQKSEQEWQAVLSPEQFRVLRKQGTEAPGSHEFDKHMPKSGTYTCAGCDAPLYTAQHKFSSGCGWPAYFDSIPGAITQHEDNSFFAKRVELRCSSCGGHLGHLFKGEGYKTPTDERHCINGISLRFKE